MNSANQIYYWAHMLDDIIIEQLNEDKKTYLAKYQGMPDVKTVVDSFWKIKSRLHSPENDIDYWIKKPFKQLKDFVNSFSNKNKSERRSDACYQDAIYNGASLLEVKDGYEIWFVPNYETAKILGRNYKNRPTHWCISSDDPEYWFENYDLSNFIFLIRQIPVGDNLDKIAIEFEDGGRSFDRDQIATWDLNDNKNDDLVSDEMLHYCWELMRERDLHREMY